LHFSSHLLGCCLLFTPLSFPSLPLFTFTPSAETVTAGAAVLLFALVSPPL
jgi:hypothetical protein